MEDIEFRSFIDLLMCSDPWPLSWDDLYSGRNTQEILNDFADREARDRGYADWIAAHHQMEVR